MRNIDPLMTRVFLTLILHLFTVEINAQDFAKHQDFYYYENAEIHYDLKRPNLQKSYKIVPGEYLVIEYGSDNAGDPGNHSRAITKLSIQIDPHSEEFELVDEEIAEHGGIYVQICRCQDRGVQIIHKGVIHGIRLSESTWKVSLDIEFPGRITGKRYQIHSTSTYKPKSIEP